MIWVGGGGGSSHLLEVKSIDLALVWVFSTQKTTVLLPDTFRVFRSQLNWYISRVKKREIRPRNDILVPLRDFFQNFHQSPLSRLYTPLPRTRNYIKDSFEFIRIYSLRYCTAKQMKRRHLSKELAFCS